MRHALLALTLSLTLAQSIAVKEHKPKPESVNEQGAPATRAEKCATGAQCDPEIAVYRLGSGPIIFPGMPGLDPAIGHNINGPSLIRVPDWVERPLGRYYLYFSNHQGGYIEMAYADALTGPWHIYQGGVLSLGKTAAIEHVASPDVIIDHQQQRLVMYFHGPTENPAEKGQYYDQSTFVAHSSDGLSFAADPRPLSDAYMRAFEWQGRRYGLAMAMKKSAYPALLRSGQFFRASDRQFAFEQGPRILDEMRHSAVLVRGHKLHILFTRVGDKPERIYHSTVDLRPDWSEWTASPPREVLRPVKGYEGAHLPLSVSRSGNAASMENALRDPAIFVEGNKTYLLYAVGGEKGIALAEIRFLDAPSS